MGATTTTTTTTTTAPTNVLEKPQVCGAHYAPHARLLDSSNQAVWLHLNSARVEVSMQNAAHQSPSSFTSRRGGGATSDTHTHQETRERKKKQSETNESKKRKNKKKKQDSTAVANLQ